MTGPGSALFCSGAQNNTKCLTRSLIENNGLSPAEWREITIIIIAPQSLAAPNEEYKSD